MIRPRRIQGVRRIRLGSQVLVCEYSWIAAIERFREQRFEPMITIGDQVSIGRFCCITAIDRIEIGDGCMLSEHVYLSDHVHGHNPLAGLLQHQALVSKGPVRLGKSCFLGYRAAILPGVELGDHCVVGANTVVTRSFPAYSMLAGTPARLIRRFDLEQGVWVSTAHEPNRPDDMSP